MQNGDAKKRKTTKIIIATGYSLLLEALSEVLEKSGEIKVVGKARDGFAAIELVRHHRPDVLLLQPTNIQQDGLETVSQITSLGFGTKILILPLEITNRFALRMLSVGARGLLPRTATCRELTEAIRSLHRNGLYLAPDVQRLCAERYLLPNEDRPPEDALSDREFQVMRLLALGHTNREIALHLSVSKRTVDTHRGNLLKKLQLRNNSDITRFAIRNEIINC